ncbi:MAG: carboxylating nicotinate-nucleotide diphosphorylase [Cyanobacteria bacterium TGS_CYA1]|nr:carboxylating nicotinate-nucleotide diphosphorylase [Cyanobacteria bacterium TGS_CYA1]
MTLSNPAKNAYSLSPELADLKTRSIDLFIEEDLGKERLDITTSSVIPKDVKATANFLFKQNCVVAGLGLMPEIFNRFDSSIEFESFVKDGDSIENAPRVLASIKGNARALLSGERLALNILQRLCGVATITKKFVELASPIGIKILDTRKTGPGMRVFEKMAVQIAGGTNHRFGLYDQVLIKDNHLVVAGSITKAVEQARKNYPDVIVEVETTNETQVKEAFECKADIIMLDNMKPDMIKRCLDITQGKAKFEISGGVNLTNIKDYLIPGVYAISVGALTHSAPAIDISLEFEFSQ